jgi:acyl-CoA synthetase (AMP-forming)/AMP-acid ligase II
MFIEYLDRGVRHNPDGRCIVRGDGSGALTHQEFSTLTHRVALGVQRQGFGPGSKVAIFGPNSPTAYAGVVGIMRSGAAWVALNSRSEISELTALMNLLGCEFLLFDEEFRNRAEQLIDGTSTLRGAIAYRDGTLGSEFEAWLGPVGEMAPRLAFKPDAPVMYVGTGGTTGTPKAVPVSNRQYLLMCLGFETHAPEPSPSTYLMATPMTHAAGATGFPTLAGGGTIIVHDGATPSEVLASIERHQVTRTFLPPTAIYALLAAPELGNHDYSSLRHFIYGAAPMSIDKLEQALDAFGPVMAQLFGQTEAPMICTFLTPQEHSDALADPRKRQILASCGRATAVVSVEIMDGAGRILGPDERGEIVIRGDLVMDGYYRNPEATLDAQRPGGWHGTGDIGYRDRDGYFYIVDRKRDMIITGGFNVFPSEVERVIWSHDAVLDCAVIGVPDEKWGEAVTAVVELKEDRFVDPDELIALCKRTLGSVQAPKAVHFQELPRSTNGKVLKRTLRDTYWAGRERLV